MRVRDRPASAVLGPARAPQRTPDAALPEGPLTPRVGGAAGASQTPPPPTPRAEAGLGLEAGTGPAEATELVMAERGRGCGAQRQTRGARPRKRRLLVRAAVNETVRGVLGLTLPVISGKRVCAFGVYCVLPPVPGTALGVAWTRGTKVPCAQPRPVTGEHRLVALRGPPVT